MIGRKSVSWINENGGNIYFFVWRVRHEFKLDSLSANNKWQVEVECLFKTDLIQCGDQICQIKCLKWWHSEAQSQLGGVSYLNLYSCYYIPGRRVYSLLYTVVCWFTGTAFILENLVAMVLVHPPVWQIKVNHHFRKLQIIVFMRVYSWRIQPQGD